jgi:hypothetical protein
MSAEREFMKLPRDLRQFLIELQLEETIRALQGRYWHEFGGLSSRDLDMLRQAYLTGLADGLEQSQPDEWRESVVVKPSEPEKRRMILDQTLHALLLEYQAVDHALDRLIGLLGKVLRDLPHVKEYRIRMNEILFELNNRISGLRQRDDDKRLRLPPT